MVENNKSWLIKALELRGINTEKAGSSGNMKIPECWDDDCAGDDCSLNTYTGLWQCYSHKGSSRTQSGNIVRGFAIADGKTDAEIWQELKNTYPDFNEPNPSSSKSRTPEKKVFSTVPQKYIDDCETSLHSNLSKALLQGLVQKQALTYDIIDAAQLGHDPRENQGNGRYIIPIFDKDKRIIHTKKYNPGAKDWKYIFYTEKDKNGKQKKFQTTALYPQVLTYEEETKRQLLFSHIVIVEGMFSALCLIPFLNPEGIGVVCQIGGANATNWLKDPDIRHQLVGKRILILFDIDKTGIEAAKHVARMLKHKGENDVFLGNMYDVMSDYKEHNFIYGADSKTPNPENKILNGDPVNWVKDEAKRLAIPITGDEWPQEFLDLIDRKIQCIWRKAIEQEDEATYTDEDGDILVKPDCLDEIADLYLEKLHSECDILNLRHCDDSFRKQKKDGVIYLPIKKGVIKRSIRYFCRTLKVPDKDGFKNPFKFNDHTVNSLANFVEWEVCIDDDMDDIYLIDPKLSPEFPADLRKVSVMNTEYIDTTKFLETGDLNDIIQIPATGNLYTDFDRSFDFQIKVKGEKIIKAVKELWWPDDEISQMFFWEMIGYFGYYGNPLQKIFYIWGLPGCGRSDILHIAEHIVGIRKSHPGSLNKIGGQFAQGLWGNKALITFADVNLGKYRFTDDAEKTEILKTSSGGDRIIVMIKFKMEVGKVIRANLLMTANVIISLHDASQAIVDRFRMLKLYNPFRGKYATKEYVKAREEHFWQQIVNDPREMQAIFNQGLLHLPALLERKDFIEPDNCKDGRIIFETRSNKLAMFFEKFFNYRKVEKDRDCYVTKQNLETLYEKFATAINIPLEKRLGKINLGEALVEYNPQVNSGNRKLPKNARVWENVEIKNECKKFLTLPSENMEAEF